MAFITLALILSYFLIIFNLVSGAFTALAQESWTLWLLNGYVLFMVGFMGKEIVQRVKNQSKEQLMAKHLGYKISFALLFLVYIIAPLLKTFDGVYEANEVLISFCLYTFSLTTLYLLLLSIDLDDEELFFHPVLKKVFKLG